MPVILAIICLRHFSPRLSLPLSLFPRNLAESRPISTTIKDRLASNCLGTRVETNFRPGRGRFSSTSVSIDRPFESSSSSVCGLGLFRIESKKRSSIRGEALHVFFFLRLFAFVRSSSSESVFISERCDNRSYGRGDYIHRWLVIIGKVGLGISPRET